ncbi:MAG: hypothetical protein ACFFAV_08880 [Candidatus Hermodarchaeota archaeon]
MKLQYYETMDDKSKEYILYLIEQIVPQFTKNEFDILLKDFTSNSTKKSKDSKSNTTQNFVQIGNDTEKNADLSTLTKEQLKLFFQLFISKEENNTKAVKWRFYQYIKYMKNINIRTVKINLAQNQDRILDFIIETYDKEIILILCYEVLDLKDFKEAINNLNEYAKNQSLIPDRIIFATGKAFRNLPLDIPIKIVNREIEPELWIEWIEENRPFNKEDLLILNDSELKVAGFNFTSTDDLLNYVFKYSNGGQISIFKQLDFFTEVSEEEPEVELIWKGIMLK